MKAEDIAPSPTISRSMFGMRKATKKASERSPAPRVTAMILSRMYPVTRDASVSGVMIDAERTSRAREMSGSLAAIECFDSRSNPPGHHLSDVEFQNSIEHLKGGRTHGQRQQGHPDRQPR